LTYFVKKYDFAAEKGAVCTPRWRPSGAAKMAAEKLGKEIKRELHVCEEIGIPGAMRR